MNTAALKINITQRILSIEDVSVLEKITNLLDNENVIGFDAEGNPISEKAYANDIRESLNLLNEGKLETLSEDKLKKEILGQ
ncbi:hypothetical protein [Flavobacterium sp. 3HN19-14]|uniref:hypothetical protein n=1 Tax=Flavobacterium sp. 3HN19-14 TaxID=3448133 RepID=UPI003EE3C7F3